MDIEALAISRSTADLHNSVSIAMLSKSLDASEDLGEGLVRMLDAASMERSVNPHIGGNIDITV